MSLRTRIAVLIGVTVLLASAIGGIGTAVTSQSVGRDRLDQELLADASRLPANAPRLAAQVQLVLEARSAACEAATNEADGADVEQLNPPPDPRNAINRANTRLGRRDQLFRDYAGAIQLVRPDGRVVSACETIPVGDVDLRIAESGRGQAFRSVTVGDERFRILTRGMGDLGAIQYARSLAITEDTLRGLIQRIVGFGLVGALLAGAVGWLLARRATEPVRTLSSAADRIAHTQDLGERIDVQRSDEIGTLATSFNTMLESLDTSREQQKRLVQDASHELRTPLTSMQTNVELLQRHQDIGPAVRAQVLADIRSELAELTELTAELVVSATEVPTQPDLSATVDLIEIAEQCVGRARRRYPREIELQVTADTERGIPGDGALLQRAVTNLINNAVKFSQSDAPVTVAVGESSIHVLDRGPGIDAKDLPHIFDRFYRATAARSAPGSGLGLSIVKQIVDAHGGAVHASNREDGPGLQVGFVLPTPPT